MIKDLKRRDRIVAWLLLFIWVGFIYLTLSTVPDWRDTLVKKYGESVFTTITFAGGLVAMVILLSVMIFHYRRKNVAHYVILLLNLAFLAYVLKHWISLPVEQIHFLEYGMVGFLSFNALRHHLQGWGLITAAILLTFLFGMVDETIQGLLANRVGEQRDMFWNGLAGAIVMSIEAFSLKPRVLMEKSGVREIKAHLLMAAFCLLVQGYFNTKIAQFGYLIRDAEYNLTFKSRLQSEALLAYRVKLDDWKTKIAPRIGKVRMNELLPQVYNPIHEEALVHCFRRAYHFRLGHIRIAYSEDLIINKYFNNFVSGTKQDWPRSLSAQMRPVVGQRFNVPYHSIVADHLITRFNATQMWGSIALLEAGIWGLWIGLHRRKMVDHA